MPRTYQLSNVVEAAIHHQNWIWTQGYDAAKRGEPKWANPCKGDNGRTWKSGWNKGSEDLRSD